jgi:hypothetical protein
MILEFNEWGDLIIDLDSLSLWISSGDSVDEHFPTGGYVVLNRDGRYLHLTPENAKRLYAALGNAITEQEVAPDNFAVHKADFVKQEPAQQRPGSPQLARC